MKTKLKKSLCIFFSVVMVIPFFSVCAEAVELSMSDKLTESITTVEEKILDVEFFKDSSMTEKYGEDEALPAGEKIYYRPVAMPGYFIHSVTFNTDYADNECIITDTPEDISASAKYFLIGDRNNDGELNISDAAMMLKSIANSKSSSGSKTVSNYSTNSDLIRRDMNYDGKTNIKDVMKILRIIAGHTDEIPEGSISDEFFAAARIDAEITGYYGWFEDGGRFAVNNPKELPWWGEDRVKVEPEDEWKLFNELYPMMGYSDVFWKYDEEFFEDNTLLIIESDEYLFLETIYQDFVKSGDKYYLDIVQGGRVKFQSADDYVEIPEVLQNYFEPLEMNIYTVVYFIELPKIEEVYDVDLYTVGWEYDDAMFHIAEFDIR